MLMYLKVFHYSKRSWPAGFNKKKCLMSGANDDHNNDKNNYYNDTPNKVTTTQKFMTRKVSTTKIMAIELFYLLCDSTTSLRAERSLNSSGMLDKLLLLLHTCKNK